MATCRECIYEPMCMRKRLCHYTKLENCEFFVPKSDYVKRERGEWKIEEYPKQNKKWLICSNCTAVIDCNEIQIDENEFDFCPYCSADMRKENDKNKKLTTVE